VYLRVLPLSQPFPQPLLEPLSAVAPGSAANITEHAKWSELWTCLIILLHVLCRSCT